LGEALERARTQHGEAALVLSQESADNGDVWLSVSERKPAQTGAEARASAAPIQVPIEPERGHSDVLRRLERSQASSTVCERVLDALEHSQARGAFAIDAAAAELARGVRIAHSPRADGRLRALAFVGPTGVGKTTTLAKLAVRLVRAGRRVAMVTTDTFRVGAFEQLAAYGQLLKAPVELARDGEELAAIAARSAHVDVLLIDTTGRSPHDGAALARLNSALESTRLRAQLETYLVLAASASREALESAAQSFAVAKPNAAILTKLDETRAPAPAVELGSACGSGLLFLCDGQEVSEHLRRADAEACADLLLRGRLS
jgi:flagellar biosynthesis protein FlhF